MEKETNLLDVCIAIWRGIVRFFKWIGNIIATMFRITFQRWYIILPLMIVFVVALYYWKRPSNRKYEVEGIVLLNGPTYEHFQERYKGLMRASGLTEESNLGMMLHCPTIEPKYMQKISMYPVIDVGMDGYPDFVDKNGAFSASDTTAVRMEDRACIHFKLKNKLDAFVCIEEGLLDYFNSDPVMQLEYQTYVANLERQVRFNHDQIEKLDSLTSVFYFQQNPAAQIVPTGAKSGQEIMIGNRKISLFLDDIDEHMQKTVQDDIRLARATAPVVFENHLTAWVGIYYHPLVRLVVNCFFGWILALVFGSLIVYRKEIIAFLRGGKLP